MADNGSVVEELTEALDRLAEATAEWENGIRAAIAEGLSMQHRLVAIVKSGRLVKITHTPEKEF